MDWGYWRTVLIVTLVILVVILLYRKILRWVGGNARFDDQFAFLYPLEEKETNQLVISFELPVSDTVTLTIFDELSNEQNRVLDAQTLDVGKHQYELDTSAWSDQQYTVVLKSGNQKVERFYRVKRF